jgi:hypothetical protein
MEAARLAHEGRQSWVAAQFRCGTGLANHFRRAPVFLVFSGLWCEPAGRTNSRPIVTARAGLSHPEHLDRHYQGQHQPYWAQRSRLGPVTALRLPSRYIGRVVLGAIRPSGLLSFHETSSCRCIRIWHGLGPFNGKGTWFTGGASSAALDKYWLSRGYREEHRGPRDDLHECT